MKFKLVKAPNTVYIWINIIVREFEMDYLNAVRRD